MKLKTVSASKITSRHVLLVSTIGVTEEERWSDTMARSLPIVMTLAILGFSLLQVYFFLLYNYKASFLTKE